MAYLLVGGINTVVGLAWFYVLHLVIGDAVGYLGTLIAAYALGMITGFAMQRRFVFRVAGPFLLDLMRFSMVTVVTFGLNALLLAFFVEVIGVPVFLAQVLSIALTVVMSYFAHRSFSFRRVAIVAPGEGIARWQAEGSRPS
ncbi:MAG: GtrA family protein [Aeromicrobium sp.]